MSFTFLINCSFYNDERSELFSKINTASVNFKFLNITDKARWVLLQENREILQALGTYIHQCFDKRVKCVK